MKFIFAITQSGALAKSLTRYFRYTRNLPFCHCFPPQRLQTQGSSSEWVQRSFDRLADWIEMSVEQIGDVRDLRNAVGFIDLCDDSILSLSEMNPIASNQNWAAVVGMLVLAFPEIQWVFITPYQLKDGELYDKVRLHQAHYLTISTVSTDGKTTTLQSAMELNDSQYTPLFDPCGMRQMIRHCVNTTKDNSGEAIAPDVPLRKLVAAALDEEEAFAYFNGYTAYRFGHRVHTVCTYSMMQRLFKQDQDNKVFSFVFEDLYLNFADRPFDTKFLSDLRKRDEQFPGLKATDHRIIVTVGHTKQTDNVGYLKELSQTMNIESEFLYKPLAGVFNLRKSSGLKEWKYEQNTLEVQTLAHQGNDEPDGGHSAPGRLLEIANRLIKRAYQIAENAYSVAEVLHGATLALEAQEYLVQRTPITSLETVALKHRLEVTAECMFYGIEYNIEVENRFTDLTHDISRIGHWFRLETHRLSELSAETSILSELALKFRERTQFDEEQDCMARIRKLYRQFWFKKHPRAFLLWPLWRYIEQLLVSIRSFVILIIICITSFGLIFSLIHSPSLHLGSSIDWSIVRHGFFDAIVAFLSLQPPHDFSQLEERSVLWLSLVAVVLGYIHLGIFISHLYSLVTRK